MSVSINVMGEQDICLFNKYENKRFPLQYVQVLKKTNELYVFKLIKSTTFQTYKALSIQISTGLCHIFKINFNV